LKSAEPRQSVFGFADSPQGNETRGPQDESYGKRFLVHTAKSYGQMEPATCTAVETRLMESVASASNMAQALLNLLRNKGAPG
jgi:RNA-directed DNA polymerase